MTMRGRVLVADSDLNGRGMTAEILQDAGYEVDTAGSGARALTRCESFQPHVVLLGLDLPGIAHEQLLPRILGAPVAPAVVVLHAPDDLGLAIAARHRGATDRLAVPVHDDTLLLVVERALGRVSLRREAELLRRNTGRPPAARDATTVAPAMLRLLATVEQFELLRPAVLISGEAGTGKSLIADLVAQRWRDHGWRGEPVFIEEVAALSLELQRVLLERLERLERGDGTRVVAMTRVDLGAAVIAGTFSEELLAALSAIHLRVPPLRERLADLPLLALALLDSHARLAGTRPNPLSAGACERLAAYAWPGNVRELTHVIASAIDRAGPGLIDAHHLPATFDGVKVAWMPGTSLADLEQHAILRTLAAVDGSIPRASEILGISVRTIRYRLNRYR